MVGHPDHDLLFVATQGGRAAGLKYPGDSIAHHRRVNGAGRALRALTEGHTASLPDDGLGRVLRSNSILFSESELYRMLMKGTATQSEPFRE